MEIDERAERMAAAAATLAHDEFGVDLPWYDSPWLQSFIAVRNYLASRHPDLVNQLDALVEPLRTSPDFQAQHVVSMIDQATMDMLRSEVAVVLDEPLETHERTQFGRELLHDRPAFTELAHSLAGQVSLLVGEQVEPYYNFLSLYGPDGKCEPHMDSPEAKWTLDICIDQSAPWPLYVSPVTPWPIDWDTSNNERWQQHLRLNNSFTAMTMNPSDAVVFAGSSQWHYRDPMPAAVEPRSGFSHLLFLHYVPEGRRSLVNPRSWAQDLGVSAINRLTAPYLSHYGAR